MKIKSIILPLVALTLSSCANTPENITIRAISPAGAPALAFYDQGDNDNFVTNSAPSNVLAEFQTNYYNAIIFDSINALKSIKNNNLDFKLAKIITGGNFYLVSIDKEEGQMPTSEDKVVSFGEGLIPDLVYGELSEYWEIDNTPYYVPSVSEALGVLKTGKFSGEDVDFVFIAQPALNIAMNDQTATTYGKVKVVKNIRAEWQEMTGQTAIPQAGLFVRTSQYDLNPDAFVDYVDEMVERIDVAIDNPALAKEAMDAFGDVQAQAARFGFNSNIMLTTQSNGANGFGLVRGTESVDVNEFLETLGLDQFDDSYFLDL
ncbi:MAG: hypothetical protein GX816_00435 [Erysipelotrichia bacterium]|jgi:hypothetical protein|nr:hypothetical protein [Bacilli bacterium]NMV82003.1 hypothetical protein [Erysipelotrichia bacterium]